jgi:RNA polymerase sigma factor (sigma-70 family)
MPPPVPPPNAPVRDAELLRRFVAAGDEAAFELLVWRHSRLVFEVCRRVLRNRHDAEDATQATFLVLARKADTVRGVPAGWLARVAYRCALRLASGRREPAVPAEQPPAHAGRSPEWSDLSAALDAELNRLPDRYRLPVVLCCLHGLSYDEAAAQLNWKPGTLSGRLSRAKALLRERLTARGITPTAVALVAFLDGLAEVNATALHALARKLTATALAGADGTPVPGPAESVAHGVTRMMTLKSFARMALAGTLGMALLAGVALAATPDRRRVNAPVKASPAVPDKTQIQGEWVFDSADQQNGASHLSLLWPTIVTFDDGKVSIAHFQTEKNNAETTFQIDPTKTPKHIDFSLDDKVRRMFAVAGNTVTGIYKLDGDTLEVCVAGEPNGPRPKEFKAGPDVKQARFTLKRKKPDVFPGKLPGFTVVVTDADGKPVDGATVGYSAGGGAKGGWRFAPLDVNRQPFRTDRAGRVVIPVRWQNKEVGTGVIAWHGERQLIAVEPLSPARVMEDVAVTLRPAATVSGTVTCPELTKAGFPLGRVTLSLQPTGQGSGSLNLSSSVADGRFEFTAPAGEYRLHAYGPYVVRTAVAVTTGKPVAVEPKPTEFARLLGKPAPEPKNVLGWRGGEVKWADLKGKPVLLTFWTWSDSASVGTVRELIPLYEKHKDNGLAVIGVHVSRTNEGIDTANKLDAKLNQIRFNLGGRGPALTFPVMLTKDPDGFDG